MKFFWQILLCFIFLIGCRKNLEEKHTILTIYGNVTDAISGQPVTGSGTVTIDGYNSLAGVWIGSDPIYMDDLGTGTIDNNGNYKVSFPKWSSATSYNIYFAFNNQDYDHYERSEVASNEFRNNAKELNIKATRLTGLNLQLKNISPYDTLDMVTILSFTTLNGGANTVRKSLTMDNCFEKTWNSFVGGANASVNMLLSVTADKVQKLVYKVRKNGVDHQYSDSILCPRNVVTTLTINY